MWKNSLCNVRCRQKRSIQWSHSSLYAIYWIYKYGGKIKQYLINLCKLHLSNSVPDDRCRQSILCNTLLRYMLVDKRSVDSRNNVDYMFSAYSLCMFSCTGNYHEYIKIPCDERLLIMFRYTTYNINFAITICVTLLNYHEPCFKVFYSILSFNYTDKTIHFIFFKSKLVYTLSFQKPFTFSHPFSVVSPQYHAVVGTKLFL